MAKTSFYLVLSNTTFAYHGMKGALQNPFWKKGVLYSKKDVYKELVKRYCKGLRLKKQRYALKHVGIKNKQKESI